MFVQSGHGESGPWLPNSLKDPRIAMREFPNSPDILGCVPITILWIDITQTGGPSFIEPPCKLWGGRFRSLGLWGLELPATHSWGTLHFN